MRKLKNNKKGTVALYITFIIVATIVIMITALVAPMGADISSAFYIAGQDILSRTNDTVNDIGNATIRAQVQDTLTNAQNAQQNNIEVSANLYQYSWIFLLVLSALVIFLFSRRLVEYGGGFV